jgi:hypothetical protein
MATRRLVALQTRVDADIAKLAKAAAAREGEDVSNWLRRLVTRDLRPYVLIEGWTTQTRARRDVGLDPAPKAEFLLAPLRESTNGLDRDFVIYKTSREPLSRQEHRSSSFWELAESRWFFLRSSPTPWESRGQMAYLDGRVVLTLRRVM